MAVGAPMAHGGISQGGAADGKLRRRRAEK